MGEAEKIPESVNRGVVVLVPKKGDMSVPDNYRGITLLDTTLKLLMKVVANRVQAICESEGVLVREQGGFRSKEECVAQAVTLFEAARRRELSGSQTYICFLDFAKAYDRVPHEALFVKLHNLGIQGDLLRVIKATYAVPNVRVRTWQRLSRAVPLSIGVRQGCPASPILFNLFINDLMDGMQGMSVPGAGGAAERPPVR